ncbi:hypothetical protein niasHS_009662 [Heterodera schachtii]|uniref:Uncharacterized protein n=1 Tax=Heterodera schachtii TaxID=97005 RepID=A0ABD2J5C0_HETSC
MHLPSGKMAHAPNGIGDLFKSGGGFVDSMLELTKEANGGAISDDTQTICFPTNTKWWPSTRLKTADEDESALMKKLAAVGVEKIKEEINVLFSAYLHSFF